MEVTKDEQRKLDDLFRKIADRDEFVAQQRQAAETLRRKEAEPPVTVWAVVDHYMLRDWGQEGFAIRGIYLTLDEAVAHIHAERESHKTEGPLMPIEGNGENTRWDYSDWDTAHNYGIEQAPILSAFANKGNSPKSNNNSTWKPNEEQIKGKEYALTLEQVVRLDCIIMIMVGECYNNGYKTRPFYEEVLRRFNRKEGQR
jgi:hypothetical protein